MSESSENEEQRIKRHLGEFLESPRRCPFPSVMQQWNDYSKGVEMAELWRKWESEGWTREQMKDPAHPYWQWRRENGRSNDLMVSSGLALMASKIKDND